MRLYWSPRSAFVRLVMVTAHELGLAGRIDMMPVSVGGTVPHPELTRANPLGKIPTLITDDGDVLYDSAVICAHLQTLAPNHALTPVAAAARFAALRLRSLAEGMLDVSLQRVSERSRPEAHRSPPHQGLWQAKIASSLDWLETAATEFDDGAFGVGQIGVGVALGYLDFRFQAEPWRPAHPRLALWEAGFSARPSVLATQHRDEASP